MGQIRRHGGNKRDPRARVCGDGNQKMEGMAGVGGRRVSGIGRRVSGIGHLGVKRRQGREENKRSAEVGGR